MFRFSCPQCGADVEFKSAAAVMAVCSFCRSTVLKNGDALERIGTMTEALEDYSPIRLGVTGLYQGVGFTVIGRIQLRYRAGYWNEWYVSRHDGTDAWLSDASGQYVVTMRDDVLSSQATIPAFDALTPGMSIRLGQLTYQASDIRTAQCNGGEGELPFRVGDGWTAKVADCRLNDAFATLDYSDIGDAGSAGRPVVYRGLAVELEDLACQGLRSESEIREAAGRYRGDVVPFTCPGCGASISFVAGMADYVTCGTCHTGVDCSGKEAAVFAKQRAVDSVKTALALGDTATFDSVKYTVLGLTRCRDSKHGWTWDEYLLYHAVHGLLWLVHGDEGWDRVQVLNQWPTTPDALHVRFRGRNYRKGEPYQSEIVYAAGAFNWQARVGDRVTVIDYEWTPNTRLTSESNAEEVVWSQATRVPASLIAEQFGKPELAGSDGLAAAVASRKPDASGSPGKVGGFGIMPWAFSVMLAVFNLDVVFDEDRFIILVLPLLAIWLPPLLAGKFDSVTSPGRSK